MNSELKDIISSAPLGHSRINCPQCGGGKTLSITNEDGHIKFYCFKASCPAKGGMDLVPTADDVRSRINYARKSEDGFSVPEHMVFGMANTACHEMLRDYNCLSAYEKGWFKCGYDPKEDRLVIFIESGNKIVGAVGRTLSGQWPKVLDYGGVNEHPFICGNNNKLIMVEDVFSAISATRMDGYSGLSLMGTSLKPAYIPELIKFEQIIICLDADAKNLAIKLKNPLTYYHPNVIIRFIKKDIKNMSNEELIKFRESLV